MDPIVISDTIQEFKGVRFYLCGSYFQNKEMSLHREVWVESHGPVPDGFEVHHRDHNRSNNSLGNLELLDGTEHARHHAVKRGFGEAGKQHLEKARERAKEWHGSEAGREKRVAAEIGEEVRIAAYRLAGKEPGQGREKRLLGLGP